MTKHPMTYHDECGAQGYREPESVASTFRRRTSCPCIMLLVALLAWAWEPAVRPVIACNIPVFRYALERWRPDPFDAVVFHRGPLSDEHRALVEKWRNRSIDALGRDDPMNEPVNFEIAVVDLEGNTVPKEMQLLWDRFVKDQKTEPTLPLVVFRAPGDPRRPLIALHGPLSDETWRDASDSPVRRELRQRLLGGHSLVWLVVPGRNDEEYARVRKLLDERLPALQKEIELPEGIGTDGFDLLTEVPLEIKFSTLTLNRDDKAERSLLTLLQAHFPPLSDLDQTVLLPVFGCGRVLDAIVGQDIDADVLTDASQFLCGACSCQVKNLNPGFDLLVAGDWDALLALAGKPEVAAVQRAKPLTAPAEPKYVAIPGKSSAAKATDAGAADQVALARRVEPTGSAQPSISASTSPPPSDGANDALPPTYGMSRANRDQPERWPVSITTMMIVIGSIAVVMMVSRTMERRRRTSAAQEH